MTKAITLIKNHLPLVIRGPSSSERRSRRDDTVGECATKHLTQVLLIAKAKISHCCSTINFREDYFRQQYQGSASQRALNNGNIRHGRHGRDDTPEFLDSFVGFSLAVDYVNKVALEAVMKQRWQGFLPGLSMDKLPSRRSLTFSIVCPHARGETSISGC